MNNEAEQEPTPLDLVQDVVALLERGEESAALMRAKQMAYMLRARPSSPQSAREAQLDGLEICLRDLNNPDIAENAERRATTVNEGLRLLSRVTAALSATPSDPAEPNIEQGRVPALGLYPDESAPSVAGGEPAEPSLERVLEAQRKSDPRLTNEDSEQH